MSFLSPQRRFAALVALMLVSYLGVAGVARDDAEAAPGSPGTPQQGTTVAVEDFEAGQGSQFTRLPTYTGQGGASFYVGFPYHQPDSCTAFLGSMQWPTADPNPEASGCRNDVDGGWGTHRTMAGRLGSFAGGDPDQNHALTFVGNGSNGASGNREIATVTGPLVPFSNPTNRYLALGFDILGRTTGATGPGEACAPREISVSGELLFRDTQGQNPYHTGPLDSANPCDSPDQTSPGAPAGSYVAKRLVTEAVPVSSTYVRWGFRLMLETDFNAGTAGSNNSTLLAVDNVRLIDATPQLDQSFSPTSVDLGGTSTLTYTITNTSELSAKQGLSFVNTLPPGLRVADPSNATNNCGGSAPTVSSETTITAQGELAQGQASCTISIDVTSSSAATYANQPSDFMTLSNLQVPASASVTFTDPPTVPTADLAVQLAASPQGVLVHSITYTATVTNNGPNAANQAQIRFSYPAGYVNPRATGCSINTGNRTVTCDLGAIADAGSVSKSIRLTVGILTIDQNLTVTATRTSSTPEDTNPANDYGSATCAALTKLLVFC